MTPRVDSLPSGKPVPRTSDTPAIPRAVWFLGLTSLFTDAAAGMIYPLLPV